MGKLRSLIPLVSVVIAGCSQLDEGSIAGVSPPLSPTAEISATPDIVEAGTDVTLTVSSEHAKAGIILPIGFEIQNGTHKVAPEQTTTYVFVVNGDGGAAYASVVVIVRDAGPPTASIEATRQTIDPGESTTLTVSSTNGDEGFLSPLGVYTLGGEFTVAPSHTTTYFYGVKGKGGWVHVAVTVEVTGSSDPRPTAEITADLLTIDPGQDVTLTLVSTNGSDGLLVPTGATLLNGTVTDTPDFTTTYLFIVDGPGGSAHDAVTVEVIQPSTPPPPPIATIVADPEEIPKPGLPVELTVMSTDADLGLLTPPGIVILDGTITVTPDRTTTFFFSVLGPGGSDVATTTVVVEDDMPPAPTATIHADPTVVEPGQESVLTVTSTDALFGEIAPLGVEILNGTVTVRPSATTIYVFTVNGPGGTASVSAKVTVSECTDDDDDRYHDDGDDESKWSSSKSGKKDDSCS